MAGSRMFISQGLMRALKRMDLMAMLDCLISDCALKLGFPVSRRRRSARRRRMLSLEVSGRRKKRKMKTGAESQRSSYMLQCQSFVCSA